MINIHRTVCCYGRTADTKIGRFSTAIKTIVFHRYSNHTHIANCKLIIFESKSKYSYVQNRQLFPITTSNQMNSLNWRQCKMLGQRGNLISVNQCQTLCWQLPPFEKQNENWMVGHHRYKCQTLICSHPSHQVETVDCCMHCNKIMIANIIVSVVDKQSAQFPWSASRVNITTMLWAWAFNVEH